MILNNAVTK